MKIGPHGVSYSVDGIERHLFGRVLVTIDDLQALFNLLQAADATPDKGAAVCFGGGEFDDPEDMRSLSDGDLARLTVKGAGIEVVLADTEAYVAGPPRLCRLILDQWATPRRVWRWPHTRKRVAWRRFRRWALLMVPLAALLVSDGETRSWVFATESCAVTLAAAYFGPMSFSCAIVKPMSIDEYRKQDNDDAWKRRAIVTTIAVALLGITATAILKYQ